MITVWPSRDLTVRAWPSSFSTAPRMRVGVPCGACWAPAGKTSSAINAPASSIFVVIAVPPLVQLLSDVAIPSTNRARRASRRPHFLVTPGFGHRPHRFVSDGAAAQAADDFLSIAEALVGPDAAQGHRDALRRRFG